MPEGSLIFPAAEYRRRIAALQHEMSNSSLGALLLTTPADVFNTGLLSRFWESPARPWFIVVPAAGDPVAVIPSTGADLMRRCWIRDIPTWNAPNPVDDGVSLLADTLVSLLPPRGNIGIPMGLKTYLRMPVADFMRLQDCIAPRKITDGTEAVLRGARSNPKPRSTRSGPPAPSPMPPLRTQECRCRKSFAIFRSPSCKKGPTGSAMLRAGRGGYGVVISPADDRSLQRGDVLMLDTGAVRDGYFCDFDRNFSIGPADDDVRRAQAALFAATKTALSTLRPGILACDLHRLITQSLTRHGAVAGGGRLDHGLGIALTEWPSVTPLGTTELREGMVPTLEPGVEIARGHMLVHEENIVLRAQGPELLSRRAPAEMPQITG
jgi:Xaa-Pro aminopeptidase